MGIRIDQSRVTPEIAEELLAICPFGGMTYEDGRLSINAGCKNCRLCVKTGPAGVCLWEDEKPAKRTVDKDAWRGIAVYAEKRGDGIHPVTLELLGKAGELAEVIGHPVYAIMIGSDVGGLAEELRHYGADKVFVYDDPAFADFTISPYAAAFADFIEKIRPSSILVGATNIGRSLAPKVAARFNTGLTADCTVLEMKENSDLVQIRPAFGGNIMARIVTERDRPQFATVRYKIFSAPERSGEPCGELVHMEVTDAMRASGTKVLKTVKKPEETDISEADVIVAVGRAFKKESDLEIAKELASLLGAQLAGTRPMVEAGLIEPKRQIGLSGRTVKPKLIITLGISGSVQFVAGMKGSERIIAINRDPHAAIFDVAHVGFVGDVYEIVPELIKKIREAGHV